MKPGVRILLATDAVGGVWRYNLELAHGLAKVGIEGLLAVLGPSPSAWQRAEAKAAGLRLIDTGLPLDWLGEDDASVREAGLALASLAGRKRVDIVQLNGASLAACADFGVPVVAIQHSCVATWWEALRDGELPPEFRWRRELTREGLEAADAVVTPTAAFGAAICRVYGLNRVPAPVYNGRAPMMLCDGAPHDCVFTAGRLWDEGKNLRCLDRAAARLAVPVYAAGPLRGPAGQGMRLEAVQPLGELHEVAMGRWLRARPIFSSPALYEPFGLAVLEAAAAGCALVLSDIPTFRELWEDAAIFVPARDDAALAAAIEGLIGDNLRRSMLGRAARERASRYRPEPMVERMVRIYAELLGAQAPLARMGAAGAA